MGTARPNVSEPDEVWDLWRAVSRPHSQGEGTSVVCKVWLRTRSWEVIWDLLRNADPPDPFPGPLNRELWSWEASHSGLSSPPGEGETHLSSEAEWSGGSGRISGGAGFPGKRSELRVRTGVEAARSHCRLPGSSNGSVASGAS